MQKHGAPRSSFNFFWHSILYLNNSLYYSTNRKTGARSAAQPQRPQTVMCNSNPACTCTPRRRETDIFGGLRLLTNHLLIWAKAYGPSQLKKEGQSSARGPWSTAHTNPLSFTHISSPPLLRREVGVYRIPAKTDVHVWLTQDPALRCPLTWVLCSTSSFFLNFSVGSGAAALEPDVYLRLGPVTDGTAIKGTVEKRDGEQRATKGRWTKGR
jgi:hypothetical protein